MRQSWLIGFSVVGIAVLFALGWGVTTWMGRRGEVGPEGTKAGGPEAETQAASNVATSLVAPGPSSGTGAALDGLTPPPSAADVVRRGPGGLALAQASRGRIMDVSKNPAFAGLTATAVSVDAEAAPAEQAMLALYQGLGIPLPPNGRASTFLTGIPPTTLHLHNVEYLEALLEFSAASNARLRNLTPEMLEFSPVSTGGPASIRDQSAVGVWCVAGPFAVTIDRIDTAVSYPVGGQPSREATITITTLAEPKLSVARYPHQLLLESLVDDTGKTLTLSSAATPGTGTDRTPSTTRFNLEMPAGHGHRIALLRGTAPFSLSTEPVTFDVPLKPTPSRVETVGGMKVEFSVPEAPPGGPPSATPPLHVRFSRGEMPLEKWQALAPVLASVPIQALGGNAPASPPNVRPTTVAGRGPAAPAVTADTVEVTATFSRSNTVYPAADHALVSVPTGVREVGVPFEFKDLVLP